MTPKRILILLAAFVAITLPAGAATYTIDGAHSTALFKVKHFDVANFYGMFNEVEGSIDFDPEKPAEAKINVTIKADSVDSRNTSRDDHIKSPDFLNAKQFPTITFKSTGVKPLGGDRFEVTGTLTLHGVTKELSVIAEKTGSGKNPRNGKDMVGFETRFKVDRTEYDMGFMAGPLSAGVEFTLALEAAK